MPIKQAIRTVKNNGDIILSNILDSFTGESVEYIKIPDPTGIFIGGVLYRQRITADFGTEVFKRIFQYAVKPEWYGAKGDGTTDNTAAYALMAAELPAGSVIQWTQGKTYKGSFISLKPFNLDLNGATLFSANSTDETIRMGNGASSPVAITSTSLTYGARAFVYADASTLSPGDLILLQDQATRPSDGQANVNVELLKIKSIAGTTVLVDDMIRSTLGIGSITLSKVVKIGGFFIKNGYIKDCAKGILLNGCEDVTIENIRTERLSLGTIRSIRCNDIRVFNCSTVDATASGAGEGYGVSFEFCRNLVVRDIYARNMRHGIDFSTCYTAIIDNINVEGNLSSCVVLAHNTFGGNFNVSRIKCNSFRLAVQWAAQGVTDFGAFIARDIIIRDVEHFMNLGTTTGELASVGINTSYSNLIIENIKFINQNTSFYTPQDTHAVVVLQGNPIDKCYINNITSNLVGMGVMVKYAANSPVITNSLLIIDNVVLGTSMYIARLSNGNNIQIGNVTQQVNTGNYNVFVEAGGAVGSEVQVVNVLDFSGNLNIPKTKPILNVPTQHLVPYKGRAPRMTDNNDTVVNITTGISLAALVFQYRTVLKLGVNGSAVITMNATTAFPQPTHLDQEITLAVNNGVPSDATNWDILLPSGNTYIDTRSHTIKLFSGKQYRAKANAQFKWVIAELSDTRGIWSTLNTGSRRISDLDDLNTYVYAGVFARNQGSSITVANSPTNTSGKLMVWDSPVNAGITQLWINDESQTFHFRVFNSPTWTAWKQVNTDIFLKSGTTALRPSAPVAGQSYFDTTIGKPIWWNGTVWKDATGATV